ncbi:hypothetical protein K788_0002571 [Paraburkholderia caribensis MBA4]|uniref:Uncharacterized protein n=1 Tax=Paraburkholderia caribensis MBA4 TaxID=1323664 RepID=A0A0P0R9N7_9BURK|nr:hypothetical protein K788_0002571 [Paraburkholderia caribensis MBA4]
MSKTSSAERATRAEAHPAAPKNALRRAARAAADTDNNP